MITFTIEGLDELERHWDRAVASTLADGMRAAVNAAIDDGVQAARTEHRYQDQTGKLTQSIHGEPAVSGRASFDGAMVADAKYASFVEDGTKPHVIRPKKANVLAWQGADGMRFAKVVHHPGTKPHPFMSLAYLKAERVLEAQLEVAAARFAHEVENA